MTFQPAPTSSRAVFGGLLVCLAVSAEGAVADVDRCEVSCAQLNTTEDHFAEAFLSSLLLILASVFGHVGIIICDKCREHQVQMEYIKTGDPLASPPCLGKIDADIMLRAMPESISKTIHETNSAHGRAFQSFMLLSGLLMLTSKWTSFEYVNFRQSTLEISLQTVRWLCPVVGIILLVFIPMSHDYIIMIERFKEPGHDFEKKDVETLFGSKMQETMHNAAGTLTFAVTVAFEGFFVVREFIQFFKGGLGSPDLVFWQNKTRAMYFFLTLLCVRALMLVGCHACLWSMAYEWFGEKTHRVTRNPYYLYLPEKGLTRELLNYIGLLGLSIWFVNDTAFASLSSLAQTVLPVLTLAAALASTIYTLCLLWVLGNKGRYVSKERMKAWFLKLKAKTETELGYLKKDIEELRHKWSADRGDDSSEDSEAYGSDNSAGYLCGGK